MNEDHPKIRTNFVAHQAEEASTPLTKSAPVIIIMVALGLGALFGAYNLVMTFLNMDMTNAIKNVAVTMQRPSLKDGVARVDVEIINLNPAPIRDTTFKYIVKDGTGNTVGEGNVTIACAIPAGDSRVFSNVELGTLKSQAGKMSCELVSLKYKKPQNLKLETSNLFVEAAALKDKEALDYWKTIAQQAPDWADAYVGLGQSLAASNDMENAKKAYEKALRIDPDNENAHYNLGVTLFYAKDPAGAMKEFEAASQLEPEDPSVISSLKTLKAQMPVENASSSQPQKSPE